MGSRFPRLSLEDRTFLRVEYPEAPEHVAGLCTLEAAPLLSPNGDLDLDMIRRRLGLRLSRVPQLRQKVHVPSLLGGPELWVDDPDFSIERHVRSASVSPPGDTVSFMEAAEVILRPVLDRSHPLWELWFMPGLEGDRVGALFKIHHSIADGLGAVALVASLLDIDADAGDPAEMPWSPAPLPTTWALATDNISTRLRSIASTIAHPVQLTREVATAMVESRRMLRDMSAAPRTSFNAPVGALHHARVVRVDLEAAHEVAHRHEAHVNDVILALMAGGLRELMLSRGENVEGVELVAMVAATLRSAQSARELGNASGGLTVRLPMDEADAVRRVERIAAVTQRAKLEQRRSTGKAVLELIAASGLARRMSMRQRMVNIAVSDVPGPSFPLYVLGARVEDVMPIIGITGNVTLMFAALSYCGRLNIVVNADASACPDLDLLADAMQRTWEAMSGVHASAA